MKIKDKSLTELDQVRWIDRRNKSLTIIIVFVVIVLCIISINYYDYNRGYNDGAKGTSHITTFEVVSIITEKKDCEAQGGEFEITTNYNSQSFEDVQKNGWITNKIIGYILTCTSPAKEIFNIKVK